MNLTALLFGYAVAILVSNLYIMLSLCMGGRVGNSFTVYTVLLVDLVPIIYIAMPKSCDVTESRYCAQPAHASRREWARL